MTEFAIEVQPKVKSKLPALSDHRILRYFCFSILYVAQGIPEGMTLFGIPAWMAMNGKTPAEIGGYSAVIFIPFSFKILIAPLIERFAFLPMGRRRPWIIFGQFGIAASFMVMSFLDDPLNNIAWLTVAGFCVSVFISFQDIGTDALAIDIIPVNQQARANGFMWGSKIMGTAASLAIGTWLLNNYGFFVAIFSLALTVLCIMLIPLFIRERPGEKLLPWTWGKTSPEAAALHLDSWKTIFKSLFSVLRLSNSLLLMVGFFIMLTALAFMRTLFPIFTIQELGWNNKEYSEMYAATSLAGGILGMLVGGWLVEKFGKIRMISIYLILLIILTTIMAFSKTWWHQSFFTTGYVALFNLLFVFISIALFATAMQFCWRKISALQFTLYMTIYNLGQATGSAIIGPLRNHLNWEYTIFSFSVLAGVSLILIQFICIKKHLLHLGMLDSKSA